MFFFDVFKYFFCGGGRGVVHKNFVLLFPLACFSFFRLEKLRILAQS